MLSLWQQVDLQSKKNLKTYHSESITRVGL
jgi:hypothetical protein